MKLSKVVITGKPKGLNTLQQCLTTLGAPREEVYVKRGFENHNIPRGKSRSTVYDRYGGKECIASRVEELRRKGLTKYHPDLHPENTELYEEKSRRINEAYEKAKKILKNKTGD